MSDPIVEEVRKARMAHTKKFNGDLAAICKDMKDIQAKCGHKIIRLPAKRIPRFEDKSRNKPIYPIAQPSIMACHENSDQPDS